jgi:hypothetical protein
MIIMAVSVAMVTWLLPRYPERAPEETSSGRTVQALHFQPMAAAI